jgi:GNAT superfamily N-acetyltransferase
MYGTAHIVDDTSPDLVIRAALPAEYDATRAVILDAYSEFANTIPARVFAEYQRDLADVELRARLGQVLVADHGGRIVASASFYAAATAAGTGWPAGCAGVRVVAVDPRWRNRGLAGRMMEHCVALARHAGATHLCLHSASFMSAATALYQRLGYERAPQFDLDVNAHYAIDGLPRITALGYRLRLT